MSCTGVIVSLENPWDWVDRIEVHGRVLKPIVGGSVDAYGSRQLVDARAHVKTVDMRMNT